MVNKPHNPSDSDEEYTLSETELAALEQGMSDAKNGKLSPELMAELVYGIHYDADGKSGTNVPKSVKHLHQYQVFEHPVVDLERYTGERLYTETRFKPLILEDLDRPGGYRDFYKLLQFRRAHLLLECGATLEKLKSVIDPAQHQELERELEAAQGMEGVGRYLHDFDTKIIELATGKECESVHDEMARLLGYKNMREHGDNRLIIDDAHNTEAWHLDGVALVTNDEDESILAATTSFVSPRKTVAKRRGKRHKALDQATLSIKNLYSLKKNIRRSDRNITPANSEVAKDFEKHRKKAAVTVQFEALGSLVPGGGMYVMEKDLNQTVSRSMEYITLFHWECMNLLRSRTGQPIREGNAVGTNLDSSDFFRRKLGMALRGQRTSRHGAQHELFGKKLLVAPTQTWLYSPIKNMLAKAQGHNRKRMERYGLS